MFTQGEKYAIEAVQQMTVAEAIERRNTITKFAKAAMKEGTDYGIVPGTKKKTLYKPGAEKLCTLFGLSWRLSPVETVLDWTGKDHDGEPFFYFSYQCELRHGALLVGESEGSCNSWEKKYRYRQGVRRCPKCGEAAIIKGKKEYGGGWLCFAKHNGCGTKFADGDKEIESQSTAQILNVDIHDQVNTIQKMAQKRALVGSTVIAVNASEFFSSDLEELDYRETPLDEHKPPKVETPAEIEAKMQAGSIALYGDSQGDLGPKWAEQQKASAAPSGNGKAATCKSQSFFAWANEWAKTHDEYADKSRQKANMYHLLGRVGKLGFAEITDANKDDVIAALDGYARGKVDPQTQPAGAAETPF